MNPVARRAGTLLLIHAAVVAVWINLFYCLHTSGYRFDGGTFVAFSPPLLAGLVVAFGLALYGLALLKEIAVWRSVVSGIYFATPFAAHLFFMNPGS